MPQLRFALFFFCPSDTPVSIEDYPFISTGHFAPSAHQFDEQKAPMAAPHLYCCMLSMADGGTQDSSCQFLLEFHDCWQAFVPSQALEVRGITIRSRSVWPSAHWCLHQMSLAPAPCRRTREVLCFKKNANLRLVGLGVGSRCLIGSLCWNVT